MNALAETTTRQPLRTMIHLPQALVAMEHELEADYLSEDLPRICDAAAKSGATVLISSAGMPLEKREAAWRIFRRSIIDRCRVECPAFGEMMIREVEISAKILSGELSLQTADSVLESLRAEEYQVRSHLNASKIHALRNALAMNIRGQAPGSSKFPQVLIVRGDGEMALFPNRNLATEWGREGNFGYHLLPISTEGRDRKLPD